MTHIVTDKSRAKSKNGLNHQRPYPGKPLVSYGSGTKTYRDNYDKIFGKKNEPSNRASTS